MIYWRTKWWLLLLLITISVAVVNSTARPITFFLIPTNGEWAVLNWANKLYLPAMNAVLAFLLLARSEVQRVFILRWVIVGGAVFNLAFIIYTAIALYLLWQNNTLGQFLLPPYSNYYIEIIWRVARPHALALLTGLGLVSLFFFLRRWRGSRLLGDTEMLAGGFIGLMLGFERSVIALILALVIAIMLAVVIRLKESSYFVRLAEPLFIGALLSLFLGADLARILFGT